MKLKDLRNLDKDEILGLLGLETKSSDAARVAGTIGTFGIGLLVGAGIALLLAPKPGRQLREDLREKLRRAPQDAEDRIGQVAGREPLGGANKAY
jgi:hypothetical protein